MVAKPTILLIAFAAMWAGVGAAGAVRQPVAKAPVQPLPFSHPKHLSNSLECAQCHRMPDPGDEATFPPTAVCMSCHERVKSDSPAIQTLTEYHKNGKAVPWVRVYRLPEFVNFSHKTHVTTGRVDCQGCHGSVRELETMQKVKDTSMASCVECHKERSAPLGCTSVCHDSR